MKLIISISNFAFFILAYSITKSVSYW